MDTNVRKYKERDKESIINLHNDIMQSGRTEELFNWKYINHPNIQEPRIVVAENDNTVVGYAGDFPVPLQVQDTPITARQPVDIMIREDFRSAKLFTDLVDTLRNAFGDNSVAVEFGYPTKATRKIWRRFENWSFYDYPQSIRIQRPETLLPELQGIATLAELLIQSAGLPLRLALRIRDWVSRRRDPTSIEDVQQSRGYVSSAFGTPPTKQHPVCIRRDQDYWNWRSKDPRRQIRSYWVGNKDSPDAAILVSQVRNSCEIALQESIDRNSGTEGILNIYYSIIRDYRYTDTIVAPSTIVGDLASRVGLTSEKWIHTLSKSRIGNDVESQFGVDFDNFGSWTLGWKWYDNRANDIESVPLSGWEFSPLLLD